MRSDSRLAAKRYKRAVRTTGLILLPLVLVFLIVLSFGGLAVGQTSATGTISGTVTNDSGIKCEGIGVYAQDPVGGSFGYGTTDADGNYTISGLSSGDYIVGFFDSNYVYVSEYYDNKSGQASADTVAVTAPGEVTGINAELSVGGTISGTVTNDSGIKCEGIGVYAQDMVGGSFGYGATDAEGNYTISGLASSDYTVEFRDDASHLYIDEYYDNKSGQASADTVAVAAPGAVTGINAELSVGGTISGTVTNDAGAPIGGIFVSAQTQGFSSYGSAFTDADGHYTVSGLASGDYAVDFFDVNSLFLTEYYNNQPDWSRADNIAVTAPDAVTGINAVLSVGGTPACTGIKPNLGLSVNNPHWASYTDYTEGLLTVQTVFSNNSADSLFGVTITGDTTSNGVSLFSMLPINMGTLVSGASAEIGIMYQIPAGVGSFRAIITGSAFDSCGASYVYP